MVSCFKEHASDSAQGYIGKFKQTFLENRCHIFIDCGVVARAFYLRLGSIRQLELTQCVLGPNTFMLRFDNCRHHFLPPSSQPRARDSTCLISSGPLAGPHVSVGNKGSVFSLSHNT